MLWSVSIDGGNYMGELTQKIGADGLPEVDKDGNLIMTEVNSDSQPKLDADGKPVLDDNGNPVMESKPANQQEDLSWLDTKKYGSDIQVAIKKQAQAYHEAEKRMQQAINEGNSTKKEIASMKATLESLKAGLNSQPQLDPNNISDEFREQVRQQFGEGVTAEQVIMQQKLLDVNLAPLKKDSQINNWKIIKAELQADSIFNQFPDLLKQVEALPLAERIDENKIRDIKAKFITENLSEIIERAKLEGAKSVIVSPATSQGVEHTSTGNGKPAIKKTVLSAENKEYIVSHGGNPADTEEYLNRDPKVKAGYLQFAE